ncbi:GNAT family N-acetyltransferase [Kitasatospora hibisci]|uniref:GNAT family N-acetyltransferase n=1 Tax=Kitasatospora hibisci TaxID=3369522 RepID=UPI0037547B0B
MPGLGGLDAVRAQSPIRFHIEEDNVDPMNPRLRELGHIHTRGALSAEPPAAALTTPGSRPGRTAAEAPERVLVGDVHHDQNRTLIPTLTARGILRVHLYGGPEHRPEAEELAVKLTDAHDAAKARVVWFQDAADPVAASTRVQLRTFDQDASAVEGIEALGEQPEAVRATFAEFAEKLAGEGFVFLHSRIDSVGPVLVAVQDGRVAGAIGPMETMTDPIGKQRLLPQYFGVLPEYRGHGLGRLLWRAAMHWGKSHGADYQLLQTAAGGASDRLCQSEGLADLGFVCTTTV